MMEDSCTTHSVSNKQKRPWPALVVSLLLFLSVLGVYSNTLHNEFTNWDDNRYITDNELIRDLGIEGIAGIFTRFHFSDYAPLTLVSYAVDYRFWKLDPRGYHLTNILLHALNAVLVFWLIERLTGAFPVGLITALLFAMHPVQVEAVAWMAQRKTLLAMAFFLLSFLCLVRSREKDARRSVAAWAIVFFALAVLSKPVVAAAPILFAAYDYWFQRFKWREVLRRGLPFFAMGLAGLCLGIVSQYSAGGIKEYAGNSPVLTALLMLRILWDYLASLLLPLSLDNLYIYRAQGILQDPGIWLGVAAALGLAWLGWRQPAGRPVSAFAVLWFLVFLLPVSNLIPMAVQRADRYLYFPGIGMFVIASMFAERLWRRLAAGRWSTIGRAAAVLALGLMVILAAKQTFARNQVWQSSRTLWENHLKKYPASQTGHFNLAGYYLSRKEYVRAVPVYQALVRINPKHMKSYYNLAMIASEQGDLDSAITHYGSALNIDPKEKVLWNNLGYAYARKESYEEAVRCYLQALRLDIRYAKARINLGYAYLSAGKADRAWGMFESAAVLEPDNVRVLRGLGLSSLANDDFAAAATALLRAVRLSQRDPELIAQLARCYLRAGDHERALALALEAAKLEPQLSFVYVVLEECQKAAGRTEEAELAHAKARELEGREPSATLQGISELEVRKGK